MYTHTHTHREISFAGQSTKHYDLGFLTSKSIFQNKQPARTINHRRKLLFTVESHY